MLCISNDFLKLRGAEESNGNQVIVRKIQRHQCKCPWFWRRNVSSFTWWCISHFLSLRKISNTPNLEEGRFTLAHGFQRIHFMVGWLQGRNAWHTGLAKENSSPWGGQEAEQGEGTERKTWGTRQRSPRLRFHSQHRCTLRDSQSQSEWNSTLAPPKGDRTFPKDWYWRLCV